MQLRPGGSKGFRVSDEAHRVTTFELFFDLVFVFAFTQVTQYMAATHSAIGVLQALTILGLLWWFLGLLRVAREPDARRRGRREVRDVDRDDRDVRGRARDP